MALQETDIRDRHRQALSEAKAACQALASQIDPDKMAPRGRHFSALNAALKALDGTCRQFAHARADTRWLPLGVLYVRVMRATQRKFVGQDWKWFGDLIQLFDLGFRRLEELDQTRTGKLGAILPENPASWLAMPEQRLLLPGQDFAMPPGATMH